MREKNINDLELNKRNNFATIAEAEEYLREAYYTPFLSEHCAYEAAVECGYKEDEEMLHYWKVTGIIINGAEYTATVDNTDSSVKFEEVKHGAAE